MLLGEMKLTHYFKVKNGIDLYVPCATATEAQAAYKEKFGVDWTEDKKNFVIWLTVMHQHDWLNCMAE